MKCRSDRLVSIVGGGDQRRGKDSGQRSSFPFRDFVSGDHDVSNTPDFATYNTFSFVSLHVPRESDGRFPSEHASFIVITRSLLDYQVSRTRRYRSYGTRAS